MYCMDISTDTSPRSFDWQPLEGEWEYGGQVSYQGQVPRDLWDLGSRVCFLPVLAAAGEIEDPTSIYKHVQESPYSLNIMGGNGPGMGDVIS